MTCVSMVSLIRARFENFVRGNRLFGGKGGKGGKGGRRGADNERVERGERGKKESRGKEKIMRANSSRFNQLLLQQRVR
jgi:hypothetical protein